MRKWHKLIVLLGVLALSAGCSFNEDQYPKPDADNKSPDVVVSAPELEVEVEVEEDERTENVLKIGNIQINIPDLNAQPCLLYTSPSPRDRQKSRMPSSA